MKRLLFFLLVLSTTDGISQKKLFGIHAGPNLSHVLASDAFGAVTVEPGYMFGYRYQKFLNNERFSFRIASNFAQRNFTRKYLPENATGSPRVSHYRLRYFEIPFTLHYSLKDDGRWQIGAGVLFSLPLWSFIVHPKSSINPTKDIIQMRRKLTGPDWTATLEVQRNFKPSERLRLFSALHYQIGMKPFTNKQFFEKAYAHFQGLTLVLGIGVSFGPFYNAPFSKGRPKSQKAK